VLAAPVALIFNRSITDGAVSKVFKRALITPVPKGNFTKEYRPISLLPLLSKILEKLLRDIWFWPVLKDALNSKNQFPFVPGEGKVCACALTLTSHHILCHLDSFGAVRLLMMDYAKAFDSVPFTTILASLANIPLHPTIMYDRWQSVRVGERQSPWLQVRSGVPQGSVLGPLLFAVVFDKLATVSPRSVMVKYADDITVIHRIRPGETDALEEELYSIID
jgi:hypothetical protein